MLTVKTGRTRAVPLNLNGTSFGAYLQKVEEEHNVTLYSYNPNDNLIIYTGELEALKWFVRKGLNVDWDDIDDYIITMGKNSPPLWNLVTFTDLLRSHNNWNYLMERLEGYVAPYQYKMEFDKTIKGRTIVVKLPMMRLDPEIHIYEKKGEELIHLNTFESTTDYLPFEDVAKYLKKVIKDIKGK